MTRNNSLHWSKYWKNGQLTSLPQDFQENYTGSIYDEWKICFDRLGTEAKVLDLCTGNCAIALLASKHSINENKAFCITAVDAANISKQNILEKYPQNKNLLENIRIISNCKIEEMDSHLKLEQFDLITSQYGIEYSDWKESSEQVFKLLKDGGEFSMIAHSGSTEIIKYMQIEKSDYYFLKDIFIFKFLHRFYNNKISHKELMRKLKIIQAKISQRYQKQPTELIKSILIFLDNIKITTKSELINSKNKLNGFVLQHQYALARLEDLLAVTKSIVENPNWYKYFIEAGLKLKQNKEILQNNSINSGTLYTFTK